MRIGIGIDFHAFIHNRPLILGGVIIPYEKGLDGHSDADVLLHAICDSLLGAAALGDIGKHFPNTDEAYKNIESIFLLKKVKKLLLQHEYKVINIDVMVLMEEPKIASYLMEMRKNIADVLEIGVNDVSIKATTTEKMGFIGRGEGVAVHSVCLIE